MHLLWIIMNIIFHRYDNRERTFPRWPAKKLVGAISYEMLVWSHSNLVCWFSRYFCWSDSLLETRWLKTVLSLSFGTVYCIGEWVNIALCRSLHNHGNIAIYRAQCPTPIDWFRGFLAVYSSTAQYMSLNSLKHCVCTISMMALMACI